MQDGLTPARLIYGFCHIDMPYDWRWKWLSLASEPCPWRIRGAAVVNSGLRIVGGWVWNLPAGQCTACPLVHACERLSWLDGLESRSIHV
jgi:hypothetical protein